VVRTPELHGGAQCTLLPPEEQGCNDHSCAIDCEGEWGQWGACIAACSGVAATIVEQGTKQRVYTVKRRAAFGGRQGTCAALDGSIDSANCTSTRPCVVLGAGDMDRDGWADRYAHTLILSAQLCYV
jgi:hypothetical protein